MNYITALQTSHQKFNSLVCLGLDPVIEKIPVDSKSNKDKIIIFYENILNEIIKQKVFPSVVKPNYAFYAQYGFDGIYALKVIISLYKSAGFPVILDVKRGDIGTTADAYSKECFDFFDADAVTLSPYMGRDSIDPFIKNFPDRGYYILCKTSNKSSVEIQDLPVNGEELFYSTARNIIKWYSDGIGAVVGATYTEQLSKLKKLFDDSGKDIPLLIPGIGSQGGNLKEVMTVLATNKNINLHRINSSSAINYAYLNSSENDYSKAAVEELKKLNDEINIFL